MSRAIQLTEKSHCPHCNAYVELVYRISDNEPLLFVCRTCKFLVDVGRSRQLNWESFLSDIIEASHNSVFVMTDALGEVIDRLRFDPGADWVGGTWHILDSKGWPTLPATGIKARGHFIGHDG